MNRKNPPLNKIIREGQNQRTFLEAESPSADQLISPNPTPYWASSSSMKIVHRSGPSVSLHPSHCPGRPGGQREGSCYQYANVIQNNRYREKPRNRALKRNVGGTKGVF